MNRVAVGALCVVACLFSVARAGHRWGALGAFALEKVELLFDVAESRVRPPKPRHFAHGRRMLGSI